MKIPKFAYSDGMGGVVDFTPNWPPSKKTPYAPLVAVRHDSVTTSGIKQSKLERVDTFVVLSFEHVPESDLSNWALFMGYALTGAEFTYYPDSTDPATYAEYLLEDLEWAPKWVSWQNYSFTMKMRLGVGTGEHFS